MYLIKHDTDLKNSHEVKLSLLASIDEHKEGDFALDMTEGSPTQVAVQLGFAAVKELNTRKIKAIPGPVLNFILKRKIISPMVAEMKK